MMTFSQWIRGGIALAMLATFSGVGFATVTYSGGAAATSLIPVNSKQVVVFSFSVASGAENESLTKVTVQNASNDVKFGTGISAVSIFLDANNNNQLDSSEAQSPLAIQSSPQGSSVDLTFTSSITNGSTQRYLIVYDFDTNAPIGKQGNITLKSGTDGMIYNGNSAVDLTGKTVSATFSITGFSVATATSVAPGIVVPNQTQISMLKLDLQVSGENVPLSKISVTNESANFVDKNSSTDGIVAAYLYLDSNSNGKLDTGTSPDTLLKKIDGTGLSDKTNITFSNFENPVNLLAGITQSFFVIYDLGESTTVTKDSAISSKISEVVATGTASLPLTLQTPTPVAPAKSLISGITIGSLTGQNTSISFGPGSTATVLKMKLRALNAGVTLNQVTLQNSGTVKFVTDAQSNNGITRINIYDDNFQNETLDPDKGDRLIGSLRLGNGGGQTETLAPITLQIPNTTNGLRIPTYNFTSDNATTLFVQYVLGSDIQTSANDASGNATTYATAELANATSSSNVTGALVSLTGTLPATAIPAAQVRIGATNLVIDPVSRIAPANGYAGQTKVPMLQFTLTASQTLASANIMIRNTNATFSNYGQGVSKVWLYEDSGATAGALDDSDKFLAATSQFGSATLAHLGPIMIPQKPVNYLVLYDIGLNSASVTAAAQIEDITPTDNGTPITFIGVKPVPVSPAVIPINALELAIESVTVSATQVTNTTSTLKIGIKVKNNSARNLSITQASPRFFKNNADGEDASYSFTITPSDTYPRSLTAGESLTLSFTANAQNLKFNGTMAVDASLSASLDTNTALTLQRYKTSASTWQSAATTIAQFTAKSDLTNYSWSLPGYIQSMSIQSGNADIPFQNRDAIPGHSRLKIQLTESGNSIDPASIVLIKKTGNGSQTLSLNTDYTYAVSSGLITIQDIGASNTILQINTNDANGNPLPATSIWITISDTLKLSEFYAYPNPYLPNGSTLSFGFNATQTGTGVMDIYDSHGQKVASKTVDIPTIGYQTISWDGLRSDGNIIFSGIYYVLLTATDSNGNKTYAKTRLAVY